MKPELQQPEAGVGSLESAPKNREAFCSQGEAGYFHAILALTQVCPVLAEAGS